MDWLHLIEGLNPLAKLLLSYPIENLIRGPEKLSGVDELRRDFEVGTTKLGQEPRASPTSLITGTQEPLKATLSPAPPNENVVRTGLDPKTLEYQDGESWDNLWLLEGHLKGGCKACSSDLGCCWKHAAGLAALAKETQSMTTDPKYQEVIEFASVVFWKSQVADIIAGTYADEYPALALRASELRRKFKKVVPLPSQKGISFEEAPEGEITLEEAKAEAARTAAEKIETAWESNRPRVIGPTRREREPAPEELEFFADSSDHIADSLKRNGLQREVAAAFQEAITRAKGARA